MSGRLTGLALALFAGALGVNAETRVCYVGCYTDRDHPQGLRVLAFDTATGSLTLKSSHAVENPHYFVKSLSDDVLYTHESDGLGAYRIGPDGALEKADFLSLKARGMCHLALMPDGRRICWAAYSSGEAGLVAVDGLKFGAEIRRDRHWGRGPDPRQEKAHCHQALPTPDGTRYCVVDLGLDTIFTYPAGTQGESVPFLTKPAGAGPRHMIFHPNGRLAFVLFELGSRLASYRWHPERGLDELDSQSTLPPEWKGLNQDAAIRFTPDGRRLVVSNRGYDSLTVFDYDEKTGKLSFVARSVLPGAWPRDFVFVNGTDFVLVTMERAGTVLSARYDDRTGMFTPVSTLPGLYRPVAVLMR